VEELTRERRDIDRRLKDMDIQERELKRKRRNYQVSLHEYDRRSRQIERERRDLRERRRELDHRLGRFDGVEESFWLDNREYMRDENGTCYSVTRLGDTRRMRKVSSSYCRHR
jgi:predicted RNase H-like nuclease (RuvC/YqgF family)